MASLALQMQAIHLDIQQLYLYLYYSKRSLTCINIPSISEPGMDRLSIIHTLQPGEHATIMDIFILALCHHLNNAFHASLYTCESAVDGKNTKMHFKYRLINN